MVYLLGLLGITLTSLWRRTGFPIVASTNSGFDNLFFQNIARSLLAGNWLGPYYNLTLAKEMFYSFFIAISALTRLHLKIVEQILYLCARSLLPAMLPVYVEKIIGSVLFSFLALNPILWTGLLARVAREGIYISLAMVFVVSIAFALLVSEKNVAETNYNR